MIPPCLVTRLPHSTHGVARKLRIRLLLSASIRAVCISSVYHPRPAPFPLPLELVQEPLHIPGVTRTRALDRPRAQSVEVTSTRVRQLVETVAPASSCHSFRHVMSSSSQAAQQPLSGASVLGAGLSQGSTTALRAAPEAPLTQPRGGRHLPVRGCWAESR